MERGGHTVIRRGSRGGVQLVFRGAKGEGGRWAGREERERERAAWPCPGVRKDRFWLACADPLPTRGKAAMGPGKGGVKGGCANTLPGERALPSC